MMQAQCCSTRLSPFACQQTPGHVPSGLGFRGDWYRCSLPQLLGDTQQTSSSGHLVWEINFGDEQEVTRADAEDVVDIMKACLLDKLLDDTGVLDFRSAGSKSKQVHWPAQQHLNFACTC